MSHALPDAIARRNEMCCRTNSILSNGGVSVDYAPNVGESE